MYAKVTKAFPGRPDNEAKTRTIAEGEVIEGELAEVALKERWAKPHDPDAEAAPAGKKGKKDKSEGEGEGE